MKQFKVSINGHKTVLAENEISAIKGVERTMKSAHYSLNLNTAEVKEL